MPIRIPVGEWLPDLPPFANPGSLTAKNVIPSKDSYNSFPEQETFSNAIGSRCLGAIVARDNVNAVYLYAGDLSALYSLNSTSFSAVTNTSAAYATPDEHYWEFVQWADTIIAVNGATGNVPQEISLGGATFIDLAGVPPKASHIGIVRDFVVMGNTDTSPQQVRWCAINNTHSWTADAATLADAQLLPGDGGFIRKVVSGGQYGVIFQERSIFRMTFVGSPLIFQFDKIHQSIGSYAKNAISAYRNFVFFLAEEGFMLFDGNEVQPIGQGKIDKTFFNDLDATGFHRTWSAIDPLRKIVAWAYPSVAGNNNGNQSRILIYNWAFRRWSRIEDLDIELILRFQSQGFTLDGLDSVNTSIDALPASLDSQLWNQGDLNFACFDSLHRLATFTGTSLNAVVDTNETQLTPYYRSTVHEIWPIVEGLSASVTLATISRNNFTETASVGTAVAPNSTGFAPMRNSARYHRIRINTMGNFDDIQGVMVDATPEGQR